MVSALLRSLLAALLVVCALPAAAPAAQPAGLFNANGQLHALVCAKLALPQSELRYGDTSPTGFTIHDQLTFNDGRCPSSTVRLDYHETFPAGTSGIVFHRGGNGYTDEPNTKYGHLLTGDLSAPLPEPVPSGGGRGAPCAKLTAEPAYAVDVASIPEEMHYKHPSQLANGSNRGSSYEHYGDPGADQGDRTDIHYTYLLWSFVNVRGGGIVRMLLKDGQTVRACDVEPIDHPSWDRDGNVNGTVRARYVEAVAGDNCRVYGWMVWSHDHQADGAPAIAHAAARPAAAPGPASPRCPVAAEAKPPTVDTAGATGQLDGTATLSAAVHPEGTPSQYLFEYGNGPEFGWITERRSLSNAMRTNDVSAQIGGLAPGATYHYRVVATGEHGTSAGPARTFTMPAPEPPPPPPEPVALGDLRVAPASMKRSRHRRGTSATIRYALTKPATVTLTFSRATTGMLVGTTCRPAPRRGVPRGRKRCTLWAAVPGALTQAAQAGQGKLRFGGWIGRRALAAGRYRVTALPADGGPAAAPRAAGFRIRTR